GPPGKRRRARARSRPGWGPAFERRARRRVHSGRGRPIHAGRLPRGRPRHLPARHQRRRGRSDERRRRLPRADADGQVSVAVLERPARDGHMTLAAVGAAMILAGLVLALTAAGASLFGGWRDDRRAARAGRLALYGVAVTLVLAAAALEAALLTHDFTL